MNKANELFVSSLTLFLNLSLLVLDDSFNRNFEMKISDLQED